MEVSQAARPSPSVHLRKVQSKMSASAAPTMASVQASLLEDESMGPQNSLLIDRMGLQSPTDASRPYNFIICLSLSLGAAEHVTLRCGSDLNLYSGDVIDDANGRYLVTPCWVLNALGCSHGDLVCITRVIPLQDLRAYPLVEEQDAGADEGGNAEAKASMALTFVRSVPLQKYNGYLDASDSVWPQGLYPATIIKMLPSLLYTGSSNNNKGNKTLLSHNAIIPLTVLDNEMLFRVSVSTIENASIDAESIYYFNMEVFTSGNKVNNSRKRVKERQARIAKYFMVYSTPPVAIKSTSITADVDTEPSSRPVLSPTHSMNLLLRKLLSFYRSLVPANKACFRSIAISGPVGSGQSFLLEHLRDCLCSLSGDGEERQLPVVLSVRCDTANNEMNAIDNDSNGDSVASMRSFDLCASYDDEGSVNQHIYTLLEKLVQYTTTSSTDLHRARRSGAPLVIMLEEVDFVYSSDEDLSAFIAQTRSSKSLRRMYSHSRADSSEKRGICDEDNTRDYTETEERLFRRQCLLASILTPLLSTLRHPRCSLPVIIYATSILPYRALLSVPSKCPAFERVVVIPKPSATDRRLLIDSMITEQSNGDQGMTYVLQEDCLEGAVQLSAGYLPGDLHQVICSAISLQKANNNTRGESSADSMELTLSWQCFRHAIASTIPLSLLSMGQGVSNRQWDVSSMSREDSVWDRFAGYSQQKKGLQDRLALLCSFNGDTSSSSGSYSALRSSLHVENAGIVLHGPSGCGKTYLASLLPSITNMNSITVQATSLLSKYYGETEANVRSLFERARSAAPCLLFFDEFDALAHRRGHGDGEDHSVHNRILSTFLNEMDGILGSSNAREGAGNGNEDTVLVVVACSALEVLDEALIRPGRLSLHVHLKHPTEDDVRDMMAYYLQQVPLDSAVTISALVDKICTKYRFRVNDDGSSKNIFAATFTATDPINPQSLSFSLPYITCAQIKDICSQAVTQAVSAFLHRHVSLSSNNSSDGEVEEEDLMPLLAKATVQIAHFEAVLSK